MSKQKLDLLDEAALEEILESVKEAREKFNLALRKRHFVAGILATHNNPSKTPDTIYDLIIRADGDLNRLENEILDLLLRNGD